MVNLVGQTLGHYKLIALLGEGGYAQVYKGEHIHLGTHAAIKVLRTSVTGDDIDTFRTEARTIADLQHPHIIQVRDFGIEGETPFLVMDYAKGTLKEARPNRRAFPYVVAISYIKQIAAALQYAHDKKSLIHRDVKPANVLILEDDQVVLSDFGIALAAQSGTQDTQGTPHYMAPEQIQGRPELASDQYALGIMAYEWLSGDLPFQGSLQELIAQHLSTPPPSLSGRIPASVDRVVQRALTKDPQQRFPRIQDFADELEKMYQREAQKAQTATQPVSPLTATVPGLVTDANSMQFSFPDVTSRAPTPANAVIARYDELAREFRQINRVYQTDLKQIQQRFDQEKAGIEAMLHKEEEQVIQGMARVRAIVDSTQQALNADGWRNLAAKPALLSLETPGNLEDLAAAQLVVTDEGDKVASLLQRYQKSKRGYQTALRWIGFPALGCAVIYLLYILLVKLTHTLGLSLPTASTGLITTFILIVTLLLLLIGGFWIRTYLALNQSLTLHYAHLMRANSLVEMMGKQRNQALQNTRLSRLSDHQTRYEQSQVATEEQLQTSLTRFIPTFQRYQQEDGPVAASWSAPQWQYWQPGLQATFLARLGIIVEGPAFPPLPALTVYPGRENLLFKASGAAKENAIRALQSFMLRLLTVQPPGKLRFTLIDPTGLGENLAAFLQLADYDQQLIGGKVWTRKEHIAQQLAELSDHMENVIQQYLRNQYQTIDEYNLAAGEIAEPYRVLVVVGFPVSFSKETANQLTNIAVTGPRCGVSVLMMLDVGQSLPASFRLAELERVSKVIAWDGQNFTWRQKESGDSKIQLDVLPPSGIVTQLLKRVGEKAIEARQRVEIPFRWAIERRVIPEYRWWARDQQTGEEIVVPLGRLGATKYQFLRLGKGTAHHVLITGTTGSGKTNLLHVLITGLSLIYNPDEIELYLIDFKTVGFTPYATYKIPHARVVAIQSEREFGLSVLEGLTNELEGRKRMFSQARVQDIAQFRRVQPHTRMPRILLIIDEFQELFIRQDEIARTAAEHLNRFVRTGRGLGIHVILASQTLAGLSSSGHASMLDNSTTSQMTVRIALRNEKADSRLILSEDNASASHLFQLRPGEAIYNADSGAETSNSRFQAFLLADEDLSVYLEAARKLAQSHNYDVTTRGQRIFDGSRNAEARQNQQLSMLLHAAHWIGQQIPTIWLGDPVSLKETTSFQLRPRGGNNVLIVGREEEISSGLLTLAFFTLAAQHGPLAARFYIIDGRTDLPYIDRLRNREKQIPHRVKTASRNGLPALLTEVRNEIRTRQEGHAGQAPPIYLFIYGLHRLRALRPEEPTSATLAEQFAEILRDGPEQSVHTLIWYDTLNSIDKTLDSKLLDEFELRIAFPMSEKDSLRLIGSPEAHRPGAYRALLSRQSSSTPEKFIPYEPPTDEWLIEALDQLRKKTE